MQKIKNYAIKICLSIFILSSFGFSTRWTQNLNIFDAETGLATVGATSTYIFVGYTIFAIAAITILLLHMRYFVPVGNPTHAVACDELIFKIMSRLSTMLFVACGVLMMLNSKNYGDTSRLVFILGVAAAVSGVCIMFAGSKSDSDSDSLGDWICAVIPILFMCLWLIISYKQHATNPVIWQYGVEILAIATATEAFFLIAGFAFDKAKVYMTLCFSAIAAVLMLVCLGDSRAIEFQLCFVATSLYLNSTTFAIIMNSKHR